MSALLRLPKSLMKLGSDNPCLVVRQPSIVRSSPMRLSRKRKARTLVPSHVQVMTMIRKCFPLDSSGLVCHRDAFVHAFEDAIKTGKVHGEPQVCATPLRCALSKSYDAGLPGVMADGVHAMRASAAGEVLPLCCLSHLASLTEVYSSHGAKSMYLSDVILMDVVLNWAITPTPIANAAAQSASAFSEAATAFTSLASNPACAEALANAQPQARALAFVQAQLYANRVSAAAPSVVMPGGGVASAAGQSADVILLQGRMGRRTSLQEKDHHYRALVAFLPGAGVFYSTSDYQ